MKGLDELHRFEVQDVINRWHPDQGYKAAEYFKDCEKHRGKEAAEKLRNDCRIAWGKASKGAV